MDNIINNRNFILGVDGGGTKTIARLEKENSRFLEQFHTWLYNATQHGITVEQLNEPLEKKQQK